MPTMSDTEIALNETSVILRPGVSFLLPEGIDHAPFSPDRVVDRFSSIPAFSSNGFAPSVSWSQTRRGKAGAHYKYATDAA